MNLFIHSLRLRVFLKTFLRNIKYIREQLCCVNLKDAIVFLRTQQFFLFLAVIIPSGWSTRYPINKMSLKF